MIVKDMQLSDQALGALMMALQKSLMEQSDIVPVLKGFKFRLSEQGLVVLNPPLLKMGHDFEEEGEECPNIRAPAIGRERRPADAAPGPGPAEQPTRGSIAAVWNKQARRSAPRHAGPGRPPPTARAPRQTGRPTR